MALATLSIDLEARLAKFLQGMGAAVRVSEESAARIERSFKGVQTFVASLGIAAAVGAYVSSLKTAINTADRIDDLSEKYGIAADKLSAYSYASDVAGTSSEAFATGQKKLSQVMAAAAGGGQAQIALFEKLGVSYKESNGQVRDLDAVLLDVADRFKSYEDGPLKAALAQEVFGKSGAELIPLLNKGADGISKLAAEAKALGAAFGSDLAKQAGDFNDNLKRIELAAKGVQVTLVGALLPTLNATAEAFIRNAKEGGVFIGVLKTLAEGARIRLGFDEVGKLQSDAKSISGEIERVTNQMVGLSTVIERDPGNEAAKRRYETLRGSLRGLQGQAQTTGEALRRAAEIVKPIENYSNEGRNNPLVRVSAPVVSKGAAGPAGEVDKTAKAYEKLTQQVTERISLSEAELASTEKISGAQKFGIEVMTKLADRELKFTDAQKAGVGALLSKALALDETQRLDALYTKTAEESLNLSLEEADALRRIGDARADAVVSLRDETAEYGLSADQVDRLRIARLEATLASEQQRLATLQALELNARESEALARNVEELERVIDARKKLAAKDTSFRTDGLAGADRAVTDYLKKVSDAGLETQQAVAGGVDALSSNLTDSLAAGKLDLNGFINYTLKEVFRLNVVQPFLKSVFSLGSYTGSSAGFFSSFVKLFSANGNAFTSSGVVPFAKGDVFNSPQLFRFASGASMSTGVLGEAGPEAIMPLKRGADGKLGVAASGAGGGGGGGVVNNTFHVGAGITRGEVLSLLQGYGSQLKGEILQSMRSRGAFAR